LNLYASYIIKNLLTKNNAFPILAVHGTKDEAVQIGGCCEAQTCCCDILSSRCVSFREQFERWIEIAKCRGTEVGNPPLHSLSKYVNNSCYMGAACLSDLTFCEIPGAEHRLDEFIPFGEIVTQFFYQNYKESRDSPASSEDLVPPGT
jgi:hypothetical protein